MTDETRRKDDSFLRKVMVTISATIIVQAGGWIYLLGVQQGSIDKNAAAISRNTEEIDKVNNVNERLIRIETYMKILLNKNNIDVSGR